MKSTKIMLVVIGSFLITWLSISLIAYLLSSVTDFKNCATNGGTIMFMLLFGWIPAVIVGHDLSKRLDNEN